MYVEIGIGTQNSNMLATNRDTCVWLSSSIPSEGKWQGNRYIHDMNSLGMQGVEVVVK
jgi:hypothetical protein